METVALTNAISVSPKHRGRTYLEWLTCLPWGGSAQRGRGSKGAGDLNWAQ